MPWPAGGHAPTSLLRSAGRTGIFRAGFAGFLEFCKHIGLSLEPFQKRLVRPYFAGRLEIVAILPFGNGKSTLLAALGLHHMLTTEKAECIVAASAADQAAIIFDQMVMLIGDEDEAASLPLDAKRGIRAIYHKGIGPNRRPLGRIRVISADVKKNSGAIPTLVLVDELQAHPDGFLYNMFRGRLKKRNAQMVTISNAGWDEDSFLAQVRLKAHESESFTRKGMMNHARVGSMEFFEWCLTDRDNPKNVTLVKKANPLPNVTKESLREWLESPGLIQAEWLRGACGIWTMAQQPWLQPEDWDRLKVDVGALTSGDPVVMAVRVGAGAGIALASPREDGRIAVAAKIIPAPEQGRMSLEGLEWTIRRLAEEYNVQQVLYDPKSFMRSAEILQQAGIPMVEAPQVPVRYAEATATLWRLIAAGLIVHDGDEALRREVLAGQTKETEQGWRLVATEQTRSLIALALAVHSASALMDTPTYWVL